MLDFRKLRGRIIEKYDTLENFAKSYGISPVCLSKGYISKMVNSRNRINEKITTLHVNNTEEICNLMHSFLD